MGQLMGLILKSHRDEVDGAIVETVAAKILGSSRGPRCADHARECG
jgi:hypothetical protein